MDRQRFITQNVIMCGRSLVWQRIIGGTASSHDPTIQKPLLDITEVIGARNQLRGVGPKAD